MILARPLEAKDYKDLATCLKQHHGEKIGVEFFQTKGCPATVVQDWQGAILYSRLTPVSERAWRADIQFLKSSPLRVAQALKVLVAYTLKNHHRPIIIYETQVQALANFMMRFGFREASANRYVLDTGR